MNSRSEVFLAFWLVLCAVIFLGMLWSRSFASAVSAIIGVTVLCFLALFLWSLVAG
jgi:hypothetical protein